LGLAGLSVHVLPESASGTDLSPTLRKVTLRLIPFLVLLFVVSYLDRVNVGFAALQMNHDLKLSASQFGFGSSIFFLGYCLFEVPSNVILARVGARRWIARIMITWGLLAAALALAQGPVSFALIRFFLGVAEAGFFPGIIFYLSSWYPAALRARAIAAFMIGIPLSGILGGPLSAALLGLDGTLSLKGWQWLFLGEGIPAALLGVMVLRRLNDRPQEARWLESEECAQLVSVLDAETSGPSRFKQHTVREALLNPTAWQLGSLLFLVNVGFYGYLIWAPQIIKGLLGASDLVVGIISALISVIMATGMICNGVHSDLTRERRFHAAIPLFGTALGFIGVAFLSSPPAALCALALIPLGIGSMYGPIWSLPSTFLSGQAAAAGMGLIAAIGNFGGFFGPYLIGFLKDKSGGYSISFTVLAMMAAVASGLALGVRAPSPAP
jgi:ACS family tartrate transporter-like MFS transporter